MNLTQTNLSISAFFPCYNDAATIASMVLLADHVLQSISSEYEIIVVDDGSQDSSRLILEKCKELVPKFRYVFHSNNLRELPLLVQALKENPNCDVINGYKIKRHDPLHRIWIGKIYQTTARILFKLPIYDVDCDFRLMRRTVVQSLFLQYASGVICIELIKKLHMANAKFIEIPVSHFFRIHGKSQFFNFRRLLHVGIDILKLWYSIMWKKNEKIKCQQPN